jgi:hypothetical protein
MNQALYAHMNNKRKRKKKKRPSFFLLPLRQGKKLGVPIYKEKLNGQKWCSLQIGN